MNWMGVPRSWPRLILVMLVLVGFTASASAQTTNDRHAGYNYPEPQSEEVYRSPVPTINGVSRLSRTGFVTGLDQIQKKRPYPPPYHIFTKGKEAEKLIIIAVEENRYNTLFRLRALLASLTADARVSPIITKIGNVEHLNFYDLCKLAGFERITVTNGRDVAHRILIQ